MKKERLAELLTQGHISKIEYDSLLKEKGDYRKLGADLLWGLAIYLIAMGVSQIANSLGISYTFLAIISLLTRLIANKLPQQPKDSLIMPFMLSVLTTTFVLNAIFVVITHFSNPVLALSSLAFSAFIGSYYFEDKIPNPHIKDIIRFVCSYSGLFLINNLFNGEATFLSLTLYLLYVTTMSYVLRSYSFMILTAFAIIGLVIFTFNPHLNKMSKINLKVLSQFFLFPIETAITTCIIAYFIHLITVFDNKKRFPLARNISRIFVVLTNIAMASAAISGAESFKTFTFSNNSITFLWSILLIIAIIIGKKDQNRWLMLTSGAFLFLNTLIQINRITKKLFVFNDDFLLLSLFYLGLFGLSVVNYITFKKSSLS